MAPLSLQVLTNPSYPVDGPLSDKRTDRIRHRLYEVEWESEEVISSIVRNCKEWNSGIYQAMPFHQQVQQEGIKL